MREQDASAWISRRPSDRKKAVEFADQIFHRARIRGSLCREKPQLDGHFIVAESAGKQGRALLLARGQSLSVQAPEQMGEDLGINEGCMLIDEDGAHPLKIEWLKMLEEGVAM